LPAPKGILLVGVQGCGKSLIARSVAGMWRLPLLRLDAGRLFSSLVGSSEENLRHAIRTAESVAPAVLWVDEIEKGFAGVGSSNISDAGTAARVFGSFVTWLQEKQKPVFVVATANHIGEKDGLTRFFLWTCPLLWSELRSGAYTWPGATEILTSLI
jgi:SpoVK/Ycf46/Vps4 family AAA+-type ATPase